MVSRFTSDEASTLPLPKAVFSFSHPDLTSPASSRPIYAPPTSISHHTLTLPLHDIRAATRLHQGLKSLDEHYFCLVEHEFSWSKQEFGRERMVEEVYAPEMVRLALEFTGAKRAVVHNVTLRNFAPRKEEAIEPPVGEMKLVETETAKDAASNVRDFVQVTGRTSIDAQVPARHAHIDLTLQGLRDTLRLARLDITALAQPVLDAEDARLKGEDVVVPWFAAYSLWRPLKIVRRDPLALLDSQTVSPFDIVATTNRIPSSYSTNPNHLNYRIRSNLLDDGTYVVSAYTALPPKEPERQKWYWLPEQNVNEVIMLKFADSCGGEACDETTGREVAAGCVHCSPALLGEDEEVVEGEASESVEVRVYCFWD